MPQQEGRFLDDIAGKRNRRRVFRLAIVPSGDFAKSLGFDEQSTEELRQTIAAAGYKAGLNELLDSPFRRKPERSRFSDGSFPVFYSSLDTETAEAESRYHLPRYMGRPEHDRTMYFRRFSCRFEGVEKDLRPKLGEWPDLVHTTACQSVRSLIDSRRKSSTNRLPWKGRRVVRRRRFRAETLLRPGCRCGRSPCP